jgi:hypothetical protein
MKSKQKKQKKTKQNKTKTKTIELLGAVNATTGDRRWYGEKGRGNNK